MNKFFFLLSFFFVGWTAKAQLLAPGDFLPHQLGSQFTPHHLLADYFEHVAANSNLVELRSYGSTSQDRPLMLAFVSSRENLDRLEEIRLNNLRLAGLAAGKPGTARPVAIIWLSYSIHGNEPSGSECSMQVLYDLVSQDRPDTKKWLENTVIILDPSANPDGYDRYTHWYRNVRHQVPNLSLQSREHNEPWPGGRGNHYYFDLNRDWAWATQRETQLRIQVYQQWLPHVHPDLHEQFIDNPYYFAPAAEPFHAYITPWQLQFQTEIGENHAKYFDSNGWLYFTKEVFDLLYPSYGDTYPTFNGSIGMTYEQAGHSRAGTAVFMKSGDTLTLSDRIAHHRQTSLSTIEMASLNADRLIENFQNYFSKSGNDPVGTYRSFIFKNPGKNPNQIRDFLQLLDLHQIKYGAVRSKTPLAAAFDYQTGREITIDVLPEDLVISAYQPKSILAQVFLEPEPLLTDSATYDLTAWSLALAYGLEAFASKQKVAVQEEFVLPKIRNNKPDKEPYAYLGKWNGISNAAFLSEVLKAGIQVRFAQNPFELEGQTFDSGTLVMTKADNEDKQNWFQLIENLAMSLGQEIVPVNSGLVKKGNDFGSEKIKLLDKPVIGVVYGEEVDDNSYGFVWHYLEADLKFPFSAILFEDLGKGGIASFNTLILPEGQYQLNDKIRTNLSSWIKKGGKLIILGKANQAFVGAEEFALSENAEGSGPEGERKVRMYSNQDRSQVTHSTPGAVVKVLLDTSHPLSFGLGPFYFSLKTNDFHQPYLENGWNAGYLGKEVFKYGFIGKKLLEKMPETLVFGEQQMEEGKVIYLLDDPLFRAFWYQGKLLFANALFFE